MMPTSTDMPVATPTPEVAATPVARTATPPAPQTALPISAVPDALLMTLLLGLAATGLAAALRKKFTTATGKLGELLGCDLCVSFWASAFLTAVWWRATDLPFTPVIGTYLGTVFLATTGVAYVLTKVVGYLDAGRFSVNVK